MGYDVTDERTQLQPMSPTWDRPAEDLTFLALRGPDVGTRFFLILSQDLIFPASFWQLALLFASRVRKLSDTTCNDPSSVR